MACLKDRSAYKVLVGRLRERDNLEERSVDWRIILKWIFENKNETRSIQIWLEIGTSDRNL